jgi:hypothetical protein
MLSGELVRLDHALLGSAAIFASFPFAFGAYFDHLYETTPCGTRSVHAATDRTAEDQVRILADEHTKQNVGRPNGSIVLIGVEAQQRTLILRVRVEEHATDKDNFPMWATAFRRRIVQDYCTSDYGALFQRIGVSQVWLLRYADTDLVDTVVQSADQCRQ